jgi:hypothetical protein
MVHKVHYDPKVPENNNIAYKSAKSKQVNAVIEGAWLSKPISTTVEEIIRKVLQMMNARFPEYASFPRQDIIAPIQNQTDLYNPMLNDKARRLAASAASAASGQPMHITLEV